MNKMLVSGSMLKSAVENYQLKKKNLKEKYSKGDSINAGISGAFASFTLVVAVIFFILELIVLFYAISMAINCTEPGPERIVNVVLAVVFTIPYVMLNILFNECAKNTLRSNMLSGGSVSRGSVSRGSVSRGSVGSSSSQ
jgi:uncharacterized membrane protein YgcG